MNIVMSILSAVSLTVAIWSSFVNVFKALHKQNVGIIPIGIMSIAIVAFLFTSGILK